MAWPHGAASSGIDFGSFSRAPSIIGHFGPPLPADEVARSLLHASLVDEGDGFQFVQANIASVTGCNLLAASEVVGAPGDHVGRLRRERTRLELRVGSVPGAAEGKAEERSGPHEFTHLFIGLACPTSPD